MRRKLCRILGDNHKKTYKCFKLLFLCLVYALFFFVKKMEFSLDTHPKNTKFNVPDGYFDSLSEQIMSRVQESEHKRVLVRKRWITTIAAAASLALILVAGFLFYDITNTQSAAPLATVISDSTPQEMTASSESASQETAQPEVLFAKNEIDDSNPAAANVAKKSYPAHKAASKKTESLVSNISDDELENIEYQMLENYSDEIVFNDWWEM